MARFYSVVRNLFRKDRMERDLNDEVRAFVDLKTDENMAAGMAHDDARRAAAGHLPAAPRRQAARRAPPVAGAPG